MRIALIFLILSLLNFMTGCTSQSVSDHQINNTSENNLNNNTFNNSVYSLNFLGTQPITLNAGESYEFKVKLTKGQIPVQGNKVIFEINGDAGGSILSNAEDYTDEEGHAFTTITAGKTSAQFKIKVSSQNAPDLHINVIVSETGFTELYITPESFLPENLPGISHVIVGIVFDNDCTELDPFNQDLLYSRMYNEIPQSISYPALPAERDTSLILVGDYEKHKYFYGCVHIKGEEMSPHAKIQRKLGIYLYNPSFPTKNICELTMDSTTLINDISESHQLLLSYGKCNYGIANALIDEIIQQGWTCLENYRSDLDANGCRMPGGLSEGITNSSTAINDVQQSLICLNNKITNNEPIPFLLEPKWQNENRNSDPFYGTIYFYLQSIKGPSPIMGPIDENSFSTDATKIGTYIGFSPVQKAINWKPIVNDWLEKQCLDSINQPLNGVAIIDYLRERIESQSLASLHSVLCMDELCCPSEQVLESVWHSLREKFEREENNPTNSMSYNTLVSGSFEIITEPYDATPQELQCSIDASLILE